jgi:hypothetical protein
MAYFKVKSAGLLALIVAFGLLGPQSQASCISDGLKQIVQEREPAVSAEIARLETILAKLTPEGIRAGEKVKIVMAGVELGKVPGLLAEDGKPLNIAAGGVSAVMNDVANSCDLSK